MKIKVPSHGSAAPQNQTIIIKERRSGCGCVGGALAVLGVFVAVVLLVVYGIGKSELDDIDKKIAFDEARKSTGSTPPATTPATASAPGAFASWKSGRYSDPMSDETCYIYTLDGLRVKVNSLVDYIPRLVLQLTPVQYSKSSDAVTLFKRDVLVKIETEGMHRGSQELEYRIDNAEPVKISATTTDDRRAAFLPSAIFSKLDGAKTLVVRFNTTLDDTRTLCFNLSGFKTADFRGDLSRRAKFDKPPKMEMVD
jgi:hypothetical protein